MVTKPSATVAYPSRRQRIRRWLQIRHPAQLVIFSFAAVIATGTLLLSLPLAARDGSAIPFIDALFTAASATCVTGLTVFDTRGQFSWFGQLILLACIQIGGLGLMTITTVFAVATGRGLGIADRAALRDSFHHSPTAKLKTLIAYIVAATLVTELAGATLLAGYWAWRGTFPSLAETLYQAVFHAVSAFCNAGFSLLPDSMMRFSGDWFVMGVLSGLIIAGGLGYLVSLDLLEYTRRTWLLHRARNRTDEFLPPRPRLSLHSKFVLTISAGLLLTGWISYYLLERQGLFREMSEGQAWLNAWFCSVTARTAGFNTVDYSLMSGSALLCTMVLMFIGASPGSTGGGVKTSTFGLLLAFGLFRWRGHSSPHAFGRSFPRDTIDRAASVVIAGVGVIILAASFLIAVETRSTTAMESQQRFLPVLFETFSAFGTVGLSMNYTTQLTTMGKLVLALVMFIGRLGPITLALGLAIRARHAEYRFAEENVMVG
jgi:trk system potassium uptake protein TrkH